MKSRIIGTQFLKLLLGFRILNIRGRYGGGKTLLSVWIAYWLMAGGYTKKIVSNIAVQNDNDDQGQIEDCAVILDESWMYIQSRQDVLNYSAYLRKLGSYLLLPSVFDVHSRLSFFSCNRIMNLQNVGLPIWVYRWDLASKSYRENGHFFLLNPERIFGLYDTNYIPSDDRGISKRLADTVEHRTPGASINLNRSYGSPIDYPVDVNVLDDSIQDLDDKLLQFQAMAKKIKR
jgi:hypothetical protein